MHLKIYQILIVFLFATSAFAANRYVSLTGGNIPPYTNWAGASTTIGAAVNASSAGDTVWVANGTYNIEEAILPIGGGFVATNRIVITNSITVRSANNDPASAIIDGAGKMRCVVMDANSRLIGFTVTGGDTPTFSYDNYGAGIYGGSASNCVLSCNNAHGPEGHGGGAYGSTLYNCTLIGNIVNEYGGGASGSTLYNCTLSGNGTGGQGGGVYQSLLYNCMLSGNDAGQGGGAYGSTLYNCKLIGNISVFGYGGGASGSTLYNCTLSGNDAYACGGGTYASTLYNCISWGNNLPDSGVTEFYSCGQGYTGPGSITSDPLFIAAGNYHLQSNSPCINTGTNQAWMAGKKDLDGNKRIMPTSGRVDMGAYEYIFRSGLKSFLY